MTNQKLHAVNTQKPYPGCKHSYLAGVYALEFKEARAIYIGSTHNLFSRTRDHLSALRAKQHKNSKLQNTFNSYGEQDVEIKVLSYLARDVDGHLDRDRLRAIEGDWINHYSQDTDMLNLAPVFTSEQRMRARLQHAADVQRRYSQP